MNNDKTHTASRRRALALFALFALALGACKPAPCGPTRDVRHRTKVLVERYPASGDETRGVLKELSTALDAQPKAQTLREWSSLQEFVRTFSDLLKEMDDPHLDVRRRESLPAVTAQRKEHLLLQLDVVRDQCGE